MGDVDEHGTARASGHPHWEDAIIRTKKFWSRNDDLCRFVARRQSQRLLCPRSSAVGSLIEIDSSGRGDIPTNPACRCIAERHAIFEPAEGQRVVGLTGIVGVLEHPGRAAVGGLIEVDGVFMHPRALPGEYEAIGVIQKLDVTAIEWDLVLYPRGSAIHGAVNRIGC